MTEENKFIEEIDGDTPLDFAIEGDDGKFYTTLRELAEANEKHAKAQKRSKDSK